MALEVYLYNCLQGCSFRWPWATYCFSLILLPPGTSVVTGSVTSDGLTAFVEKTGVIQLWKKKGRNRNRLPDLGAMVVEKSEIHRSKNKNQIKPTSNPKHNCWLIQVDSTCLIIIPFTYYLSSVMFAGILVFIQYWA